MGTGVGEIPYAEAAKTMLDATVNYFKNRDNIRLIEVTYVLFDDKAYEAYKTVLSDYQ
jgi:O-acetyl-ADP-ribose deacetylase (regulator of RNase III)